MLTLRRTREAPKQYPVLDTLEVGFDAAGLTVITCDAYTAARLAGRDIFGHLAETQAALVDAIRNNYDGR